MFSIHDFIMKTLKGMIGHYPDFQVQEYALNWYSRGKIAESDLEKIQTEIDNQYITETEESQEEITEEGIINE